MLFFFNQLFYIELTLILVRQNKLTTAKQNILITARQNKLMDGNSEAFVRFIGRVMERCHTNNQNNSN